MLPEHWRSMALRLAKARQGAPIGRLCDETPVKDEDGPDPITDPAALRTEIRILRAQISQDRNATRREGILRQQLAEVTADRDRLEQVNDRLRERLKFARALLADFGVPADAVAELERADRQWIGHADTAVMPRVRSLPAPGGQR